jgi:hypothetical protein
LLLIGLIQAMIALRAVKRSISGCSSQASNETLPNSGTHFVSVDARSVSRLLL